MQAAIAFPTGEPLLRATASTVGHSWKAFAASLLLHAAPLVYFGYSESTFQAASAGDNVLEIELVVADIEKPIEFDPETVPETPDVAQSLLASIDAPATDVKREAKKDDQDNAMDEALPDIPPVPEPVVLDTEKREASTASAPPVAIASQQQAQVNSSFAAAIARHLSHHKKFPPRALNGLSKAQVIVTFEIDSTGMVQSARLDKGSGSTAIDAEAIAMIWRAAPFPQSTRTQETKMQFTIPVTYRVR